MTINGTTSSRPYGFHSKDHVLPKAIAGIFCCLVLGFASLAPAQITVTAMPALSQAAAACSSMSLGNGASLNGFIPFPSTNVWNTNIALAPVDPNSATIVSAPGFADWYLHPDFGSESESGIPYVVVDSTMTPAVPISVLDYASQSDVVVAPYPITAPIQGAPADCSGWPDAHNGDARAIVLDRAKCELYETHNTNRCNGHWDASSETIWDMRNNESRPWGWTSADAAGLSIFAGLVRYDEIASGAIHHALRFSLEQTKNDANNGYFVAPATHAAGNSWGTNNVIGMRIRLKSSFDISGFSRVNRIILTAMQQYGLILADNGGNFYFQGASDPRFDDNDLVNLEQIASSNFEVVQATPGFPGYDSAKAPTGAPPIINSFSATATSVRPGTPVTLTYSATGDSYDYIDTIGPVRGGSVTITPKETNTYTLYSTNAYGRSMSVPITVRVPGSTVAAPSFTPPPGTYSSAQTVTINTATSPSAAIYYTTDGSTPTTSSNEYSGPITVSAAQTLKAIATVTGYSAPSAVGSAAYTFGSTSDTTGGLAMATPKATAGVTQGPALVAHTGATSSVSPYNTVTTSPINTAGANYELACGSDVNFLSPPGTMSDSLSNTWILIGTTGWLSHYSQAALYYSANPTVGSAQTFTFAVPSGQGDVTLAVAAFSGIASGPDQQRSNSTNGSSPFSSGTVTPTNANELIFSCLGESGGAFTSVTQSPLSILDSVAYTSDTSAVYDAFQIQTTATAVNPTWNWSFANYSNAATITATFYSTASPGTLGLTTTNLAEGFVSTPYSATGSLYPICLTAVGGVQPYTWSVSSGTLPSGLSLSSSTGCLSGTPTAAVSATSVTFKVTDLNSNTATSAIPMTVASSAFSGSAGTCTGSALSGTQQAAYGGCTLGASGGTSPYTFAYSTSPGTDTIPEGMSLNSSTGAISSSYIGGVGNYSPIFTIQDSLGAQATLPSVGFAITGNYSNTCLPWAGSIFNTRVDSLPVDTSPAAPIDSAYLGGNIRFEDDTDTGGIPYIVVPQSQSFVPVEVSTEIQGYFLSGPIPSYAPVEGTQNNSNATTYLGDGHSLVIQQSGSGNACKEWEGYMSQNTGSADPAWNYNTNYVWTLDSNYGNYPEFGGGDTIDAAGLPVAALLATVDEINGAGIQHPMRLILNHTLAKQVWPASSHAGVGSCTGGYSDSNGTLSQLDPPTSCSFTGPMGELYRITSAAYSSLASAHPCLTDTIGHPQSAALFKAMREYGLMLVDNGATGTVTLASDARWNDATDLSCVNSLVPLSDLEPVMTAQLEATGDVTNTPTYQAVTSTSPQAATPTFSPGTGTYSSAQTVTVATATPSATIYYTTNGSTPTTGSQVYSGSITVSASETVEAIAVASGYSTSATGSASYTINPTQAATPTFSPAAGSYSSAQSVKIATATPSATIYYTTNGSTPTTGSQVYSGPITVSTSETVEAIAVASGYSTSATGSAAYTINPTQVATPTFSPAAGSYSSAQSVKIATATPSATIYYTTNGSTPTTGSQVYSGPITVSTSETVEAIAVASGYSTSATGSTSYTINPTQSATPTFSPAAGTYSSAQTVTVATATPSATIYYTTNGSTPTTGSQVYSGPITVSTSETVEAIAVASGYSTSATGSAAYTINLTKAATPTFTVAVSPASVTVAAGQSGSTTILVVPQNAFGGAVSFSCSGLPSGASCSFSPATVTTSGAGVSTTLTVTTSTTTAALHRNPSRLFPGSVLAVALCWFGWKRRRGLQMMVLVLVALGLSLCTGCSLGFQSNPQAAASTVTVMATSGSLQPTTSFTLTVQ